MKESRDPVAGPVDSLERAPSSPGWRLSWLWTTQRKRLARLVAVAAAVSLAWVLGRSWPTDHTVHYVLGSTASHVEQIDASWAASPARASETGSESEDWILDVSYRYSMGTAPRVITHEPRLPDGDYAVKIEIVGDRGRTVIRRHVTLAGGGVLSIDLASLAGVEPR